MSVELASTCHDVGQSSEAGGTWPWAVQGAEQVGVSSRSGVCMCVYYYMCAL